jgi:hypothetical protein
MRRLPSPGGQRSIAQDEAPEDPVQPIKAEPEDDATVAAANVASDGAPASTVAIKEEDVASVNLKIQVRWEM